MDIVIEIIGEIILSIIELILEGTLSSAERGIRKAIKKHRTKYDNFKLAMFVFSFVLSLTATIILLANKSLKTVYISLYSVGGACFLALIIIRAISVVKYFKKYLKVFPIKVKKTLLVVFIISFVFLGMFACIQIFGPRYQDYFSNKELIYVFSCYFVLLGLFIINTIIGLVIFFKNVNKQKNIKLQKDDICEVNIFEKYDKEY